MRILAFDPGETTGWALVEDGRLVSCGEFRMWSRVNELVLGCEPDIVVYEAFRLLPWRIRSLSMQTLETVQVIGVIRYAAERFMKSAVAQPADVRKRIKELPSSVKGDHARDAARHALAYERRIDRSARRPLRS